MEKETKKRKFSFGLSDRMFFDQLPFLLFLTFLGVLYITNTYHVEDTVMEIEELKKGITEEKNYFVITKTEVSKKGQRNEISKRVDSLGLKEANEPPFVIKLTNKEKD